MRPGVLLRWLAHLCCVTVACALNRTHYVAIIEEIWDYAPEGDLLFADHSVSDMFIKTKTNPPQIGSKYLKAMLREYTDSTYTELVARPPYMGLIGPFLRGEVGDIIKVNLWNRATYNYSLHPHGTFYDKDDEGAQYLDGTIGEDRDDNSIPPNGKYEYEWTIKPEYGPEEKDPSCITYMYHSHVEAEVEIMSAVIGIILVCKQGTLDEAGNRNDVDKEFPLFFMGLDENFSHYLGWNMEHYIPNVTKDAIIANWDHFQLSNQKSSINGRIYGNLKGIEMCVGDKVSLSLATAGNDLDLHTIFVQGQTMQVYDHRAITLPLYPGATRTAIVNVETPGTWLLSSQSALDINYGMQTLFTAKVCEGKEVTPPIKIKKGKNRKYYIAAEEVWWNYAPTGKYELTGQRLQDVPNAKESYTNEYGGCPLHGIYKKAIFRGYKNKNFKERLDYPKYLGLMGPSITAEVGDKVTVFFRNKATRPYSIYAYGLVPEETEGGKEYKGPLTVQPGVTWVYEWTVPENVGPLKSDPDCIGGRYFSVADPVHDTYTGLTGPVMICKRGTLDSRGHTKGSDKEFFLTFNWMDETMNPYINESIKRQCPDINLDNLYATKVFKSQNTIGAVNGYAWGNMESPVMCKGDKVNWYASVVGTSLMDLHGPYFHGNTFITRGNRKDSVALIPDVFQTLFMVPDNVGVWEIADQTDESYEKGMNVRYIVKDCRRQRTKKPKEENTRTYYIAAVEDTWDYAPFSDIHPVSGELLTEDAISKIEYTKDATHIGQKYIKAMYREFTDETFSQEKKRTYGENHLGIIGPMIKAEVGERLRVVFKNMARFNYSIMPHGVMYDKENEGTIYKDGVPASKKAGGLVPPGKSYTYEWTVPERAGPSKDDFNCITWMYLSGVDPNDDVYSGLAGPLIICRKGILNSDGKRKDVQREFALFFEIYIENLSHYLNANVETLNVSQRVANSLISDPAWFETNVMMTVNGYGYANIPDVTMYLGEKAAFYLISYGNQFQTHTVHFHGNTFTRRLADGVHRHDVADVLPGDFESVELYAVNAGNWLVHCHVNNHSENGMMMEYHVIDKAVSPHAIPTD